MQKRFIENRAAAWVILCAVAVASVVLLGAWKLAAAVDSCSGAAGVLRDDLAMQMNAARAIATAAEQAVPDAMTLQSVRDGLAAYDEAQRLSDQYAAASALSSDVALLYEEARTVLGDDKGSVLQTQYSEYNSRATIIRQTSLPEYNEQARAAADKLSGFPASLIASLAHLSVDVIE